MNNYSEDSIRYCNMLAPDSLNFEKPKSLDLSNQLAANSTTEKVGSVKILSQIHFIRQ